MKKLKLQSNSSALLYIQMLKIALLVILYLLVSMFSLSAQTPRKDSGADGLLQALQIGSILPKEAIEQISAQNSKGHKQLYILDFWTTWCGACLASFPHLGSLQRKFNANIQIILLNAEETQESAKARLQKIAKNNPALKVPELPQIYNARLFDSLFPHLSVPHHIWLDRDFKVIAITKGENTNEKNINSYLKTHRIDLPTKFELMDFEEDKSLLSEGDGRQQNLLMGYSLLLDSIYGAPSLFKLSKKGTPSLRIVNRSLLDLFKIAYGMTNNQWASNPFRSPANIELNGRPLNSLESKDIPEWLYRTYCYENKTVSSDNSVYTVMQQDLKRFFDINASVRIISVNGWMLEKGSTQQTIKYEKGHVFKSISLLQSYLNEAYAAIGPFDNGGQGDASIEIVLPRKVLGKEELFNSLKQQGVICKPTQVKKQILQLTYKD
ncbi:TlpA disulfide reductase family protein [Sphingobacterium prati]